MFYFFNYFAQKQFFKSKNTKIVTNLIIFNNNKIRFIYEIIEILELKIYKII